MLPFKNMSADPENEYFSDGMTEEIINALGKLPGIHVASRTSSFAFKGKDVDVRQIGEKLGVASVLEGSVRKIGNKIRLTAQLISVDSGYHIWSETFDRQLEDVFAVQDEISRAIVDALKLRLAGDEAQVVAPTKNLEAYTLYLKGRFFFAKLSEPALRRSLDLFQQALLQDPALARAYAGIADAWCNLADDWVAPDDAYPRAKGAAERALQREPELAEAITSLGKVLGWHEWKFAEAETQLARAVALSPNYAEAHYVHGTILPAVGRLRDGIETMRKALLLDPLSVHYSEWLTRFLLYDRDYDAAIVQGLKTIDMDEICHRAQHYIGIGTSRARRRRDGADVVPPRPIARARAAVVRRDDRTRARGARPAGGSGCDHGASRGRGQEAVSARRNARDGLRRHRQSRWCVRVPRARLPGPLRGTAVPAHGSVLRAAAEGSAIRGSHHADRLSVTTIVWRARHWHFIRRRWRVTA